MKAGIFFTGSGPILVLTSYDSLTDPHLVKKLTTKGIKKFI
ncbi:cytoplasmic protein, partial [Candidatus Thiomargarita nelsonii]